MQKEMYETGTVFVPVGLPSLTFVVRHTIERSFRSWKGNRSKHLLIFGASKSGKTSLWKKNLDEGSYIKIPCNADRSIQEVYSEILDHLDAFYTSERGQEVGRKAGLLGEFKALFGFGSAGVKVSEEDSESNSSTQSRITKPELSASLVSKYLRPTRKYIVLEDFHYSNSRFKEILSQDLKAFSDDECQWIIVGVQHKTSELLSYNEDLHQRIAEIPVEGFTQDQLREIIGLGALALNFEIEDDLTDRIIKESEGSASLVQNICQRMCLIEDINETLLQARALSNMALVEKACQEIAYEERSYYDKVIKNVAQGGRSDGTTEKYKWFLRAIRDREIPETGLKNTEFHRMLRELGHGNIEQASVTTGLAYLPRLLEKLSFPSFFDYDEETKTFFLLDRYMKFVFRWIPEMIDDLFINH